MAEWRIVSVPPRGTLPDFKALVERFLTEHFTRFDGAHQPIIREILPPAFDEVFRRGWKAAVSLCACSHAAFIHEADGRCQGHGCSCREARLGDRAPVYRTRDE